MPAVTHANTANELCHRCIIMNHRFMRGTASGDYHGGQKRIVMVTAPVVARSIIVGLALVAMAWPTSGRTSEPDLVGTGWRIVEVAGRPADPAATIAFEKNRLSGSTGCNRFFASLSVKADALAVGPIATTRMLCGLKSGIERDTLAALVKVTGAKRDGERVALLDSAGKPVVMLGR
jgi:heat shock protein HslJ